VVKRMVRSLRKTFPYCACVRPHSRMCQNAELALCMGFCCVITGSASRDERVAYAKNIRYLKNLLSGRQKQLAHRLRAEMNKKSKQQDYEAAARLRNQLFALERIFAHQHVLKRDYKAENQKGLHELVLLLGLAQYPERIEGYDISNIQGAFAVGSMVVFTDGTANRQEYRTFRIRTVIGANDTAMMRETLMRRFTHNEWPLPNVILIDGGRGQLNAAIKALASTPSYKASRSTVISIAKREEELYAANRKTPYTLKTMPPALLYLLQQIRNEAHRFAISHYRRRHRQAMREKA
jgi:excinuclease ABC subunit C